LAIGACIGKASDLRAQICSRANIGKVHFVSRDRGKGVGLQLCTKRLQSWRNQQVARIPSPNFFAKYQSGFVRMNREEAEMPTEAATWHYVVAEGIFLVLGMLAHVCRAVFNLYPDRLSDRPVMDMVVSDGFSLNDYLLGVEYDDNGFYRLDSAKNLRIAVTSTMLGGFAMMLFAPGFSIAVALAIDTALAWLRDLFWFRLENIRWF
jgi:hypothetical protein